MKPILNPNETFKASYDRLKKIAEEFKNNPEMDIDRLISLAKEAVACHDKCKSRLDAATKELDNILQETTAVSENGEESKVPF